MVPSNILNSNHQNKIMSINSFILRKLLQSKMKDVPASEQEKIISMVEKNPELFKKIAVEAQEKMKTGKDQTAAMLEVVQKYQDELKGLM